MKLMICSFFLLFLCLAGTESFRRTESKAEDDPTKSDYWLNLQKESLHNSKKILDETTVKRAKNVILFLGDGMGLPTVAAARLLKRQLNKKWNANLVFEDFDHAALIRTYNLDHPVPDSAGTGTAFMTGVKTNMAVIGVNGAVPPGSEKCELVQKNRVETVLEQAHEMKKSTGVVTTASITDATPAACYAHVSLRYFESSIKTDDNSTCKDIARQLVEDHSYINVVLGGGRKNFLPEGNRDGKRSDNLDLFQKLNETHSNDKFVLVEKRKELMEVDAGKIDYLFGVFDKNHMQYDLERNLTDPDRQPSLAEMTQKAIQILKKNNQGFFLMVEGAKIDKAHHDNQARYSLYDVIAFEEAIQTAENELGKELANTLIIVTADHSHAFTMNGGSKTDDDILGFANGLDDNNLTYTMLLYSNGPGYRERKNETDEEIKKPDYRQYAAVNLKSGTHGGDDVAAYAKGPGSNLLRGCQDQTYIANLMAYSACLGQYKSEPHCSGKSSGSIPVPVLWLFAVMAIVHWFRN